ncbi:MAG: hypothetical protein J5620_01125 [Alphaproteobacteria bacterium]|nr:hypothetical protein [Alphaproteobacteria bacterium]
MTLKIAIDLDNTVFNTAIMIRDICTRNGVDFDLLTSYDPYQCVPKHVADAIMGAFDSVELRDMPVLHKRIPETLNMIMARPDTDVYFITERPIATADMDIGQLKRAEIKCDKNQVVNYKPKIDALRNYEINLCFDDSPLVVADCLTNNIDIVMISNKDTPYNHHLRGRVEHYPDLITALTRRGIIRE